MLYIYYNITLYCNNLLFNIIICTIVLYIYANINYITELYSFVQSILLKVITQVT